MTAEATPPPSSLPEADGSTLPIGQKKERVWCGHIISSDQYQGSIYFVISSIFFLGCMGASAGSYFHIPFYQSYGMAVYTSSALVSIMTGMLGVCYFHIDHLNKKSEWG